jgi:hypothetical protein
MTSTISCARMVAMLSVLGSLGALVSLGPVKLEHFL